jgi:hypothetical protein
VSSCVFAKISTAVVYEKATINSISEARRAVANEECNDKFLFVQFARKLKNIDRIAIALDIASKSHSFDCKIKIVLFN